MMRANVLKFSVGVGALTAALLASLPASADRIKNPTAVFAGLDKITGRIITFEVATDETVQFGTLQVTPKVCYTRPPTEAPQTDAFVDVVELTSTKEYNKLFSGWMFAASPGLHGVEHAVYDVWLTDCKGGTKIIATPVEQSALPADEPPLPAPVPGTVPKKKKIDVPPFDAGAAPTDLSRPASPQNSAPQNPAFRAATPNAGPIEVGPPPGVRLPSNNVTTLPPAQRAPAADDGLRPPGDIPTSKPKIKPRKIVPVDPVKDPNFDNLDNMQQ